MKQPPLTLDFFHDVVCGWCFNLSPRLRALRDEFNLDIQHRTFVLQDSPSAMVARFGSMERAKAIILGHWEACRAASDSPEAFDIEAMRKAGFDYPHGLPGALACKAAERVAGQESHWDIFDAIQRAHISGARNIADPTVLTEIAEEAGLSALAFQYYVTDPDTRRMVEQDRTMARRLQVTSVPTIIVRDTGTRLVNGPYEDLCAQLTTCLRLVG